jgi:hypothetical protein
MLENINDLSIRKPEFVIGGDINMDYLTENHDKQYLNSLLTSFNLTAVRDFLKRIQNYSSAGSIIFLLTALGKIAFCRTSNRLCT